MIQQHTGSFQAGQQACEQTITYWIWVGSMKYNYCHYIQHREKNIHICAWINEWDKQQMKVFVLLMAHKNVIKT